MAADRPQKPRLSLTKTQLQAGVGAELLSLCQSITEDGRISDAEVAELRSWLDAHRTSELPAIAFLSSTVERILADGVVTTEERAELYKAIEAVLPPEARRQAATHRKHVEAQEKAEAQAARELQRDLERQHRERNRTLRSANFMVAGVHYEGRAELIWDFVSEDDVVYLVRDRGNKFSRNAIEVRLKNGYQIGFVPEEYAVEMAPDFDRGCRHSAYVTKILTGGRAPIPVVQAFLYRHDADIPGSSLEAEVPPKRRNQPQRSSQPTGKRGCLLTGR